MVEPLVLEIARRHQPADPSSTDSVADAHPGGGLPGGDESMAVDPLEQAAIACGQAHDALIVFGVMYLEIPEQGISCPVGANFFWLASDIVRAGAPGGAFQRRSSRPKKHVWCGAAIAPTAQRPREMFS
jgi:hypothetical protein